MSCPHLAFNTSVLDPKSFMVWFMISQVYVHVRGLALMQSNMRSISFSCFYQKPSDKFQEESDPLFRWSSSVLGCHKFSIYILVFYVLLFDLPSLIVSPTVVHVLLPPSYSRTKGWQLYESEQNQKQNLSCSTLSGLWITKDSTKSEDNMLHVPGSFLV